MTDPLLPKPVHDLAHSAEGVRLAPEALAEARRERGDEAQLSWDASARPQDMMRALVLDRGADPAILIPPARFMETMRNLLSERGGQLDADILNGVVRTCSKQLVRGSFGDVVIFLRNAWGGIRTQGTAESTLADCIRELFPAAPGTWSPATTLTGRRRRLDPPPPYYPPRPSEGR